MFIGCDVSFPMIFITAFKVANIAGKNLSLFPPFFVSRR